MKYEKTYPFGYFLLGVLIVFLSIDSFRYIDEKKLFADALQNLRYAYYLSEEGIYSDNVQLTPSASREPFPNMVVAGWLRLLPIFENISDINDLNSGRSIYWVKVINVVWLFLILCGIATVLLELYKKYNYRYMDLLFTSVAVLLFYETFPKHRFNTLLTELSACALIIWCFWSFLRLFQTGRIYYGVFGGSLLGLLILTKSATLYILLVTLLVITIIYLIKKFLRKRLVYIFLISIVTFITVSPWLIRNYISLGELRLSERGGVVLLVRAYYNQMTNDEFLGSFYTYAPQFLKPVMSTLTGYKETDREYGGRLQSLTRIFPQDRKARKEGNESAAVAYYMKATTRASVINRRIKEDHFESRLITQTIVDGIIKQQALSEMRNKSLIHLRTTLSFMWRGLWPNNSLDGRIGRRNVPAWKSIAVFLGFFSTLYLGFAGLIRKNSEFFVLFLFPNVYFIFYGLFTHFIPRYSEPLIAIWVISFFYVLGLWWGRSFISKG